MTMSMNGDKNVLVYSIVSVNLLEKSYEKNFFLIFQMKCKNVPVPNWW